MKDRVFQKKFTHHSGTEICPFSKKLFTFLDTVTNALLSFFIFKAQISWASRARHGKCFGVRNQIKFAFEFFNFHRIC
jgi:hypothetical protein